MNYVMNLKGPANEEEDGYAKRFMEEIRKRQISSLRTTLAMGKEYADAKREFEETFLRLAPAEPDFIQQIQETQPTSLLARGKEYGSAKREFDSTFTKLGFHDIAGMVVSGDRSVNYVCRSKIFTDHKTEILKSATATSANDSSNDMNA